MTKAHAGSTLGVKDLIIPVDSQDRYFPFYWNKVSGRGDEPILDVATIEPVDLFEQAVAIEDTTTNLMKNPSFKDGMTEWNSVAGTVVDIKNDYVEIKTTEQYSGIYQTVSVTSGKTYTLSYWYKWVDGINTVGGHIDTNAMIRIDKGQWKTGTVIEVPKDGKWHFIEETFTPTSNLSQWRIYIQPGRATVGTSIGRIRTDRGFGVQLEERGWATAFTPTTRVRGSLTYNKDLFNPDQFTINAWVKLKTIRQSNYQPIIEICSSNHQYNRLLIMYAGGTTKRLRIWFGNNTVNDDLSSDFTVEADKWYMITVTYDGTKYSIYVNGVLYSEKLSTEKVSLHQNATINVGGRYWGILDGNIAGLLISPRAASPHEIAAWYEYKKRFYDPYNYYAVWGFDFENGVRI